MKKFLACVIFLILFLINAAVAEAASFKLCDLYTRAYNKNPIPKYKQKINKYCVNNETKFQTQGITIVPQNIPLNFKGVLYTKGTSEDKSFFAEIRLWCYVLNPFGIDPNKRKLANDKYVGRVWIDWGHKKSEIKTIVFRCNHQVPDIVTTVANIWPFMPEKEDFRSSYVYEKYAPYRLFNIKIDIKNIRSISNKELKFKDLSGNVETDSFTGDFDLPNSYKTYNKQRWALFDIK